MRRELSANKAQALLALIRPADDAGRVRVHIARGHLPGIRALDARIKYTGTQIAALVTQIRCPATPGRLYYEQKRREGQTPKEALRCLKRRLPGPGLPPAARRPARHHRRARITYDPAAGAACVHLTGQPLAPGRTTIQASMPSGTGGFVALDWKDGRLTGIEIPGASTRLCHDLLEQAEIPG